MVPPVLALAANLARAGSLFGSLHKSGMKYGCARVSTDGQSVAAQVAALTRPGPGRCSEKWRGGQDRAVRPAHLENCRSNRYRDHPGRAVWPEWSVHRLQFGDTLQRTCSNRQRRDEEDTRQERHCLDLMAAH